MQQMLDDLDRRLVRLLQMDARESTSSLARKLKVARSTVHERIERLKRDRVISGFSVVLANDPNEPGSRAIVFVEIEPRAQNSIVEELESYPEITTCYAVNGAFDLALIVEAPQLEDIDAILDEVAAIRGVIRTVTNVVLARKFDRRQKQGSSEPVSAN
ncbi:MAG: Lrp/AsnC family transcriptional regulator [Cohaesibacteraceae bacterium]|nr:Lrp/AsnC family transcriptional regulator [Cohaesibacteraceae bacterium]MBL4875969.1 Lrp/AsnC family transcriptional regulator [Cohaesibacteraceae bacterium]